MSDSPEQPPGKERSGEIISRAEEPAFELPKFDLKEVRYSMPVMLEELRLERRSSMFAMEILDQIEIERIFESRIKPHGKED